MSLKTELYIIGVSLALGISLAVVNLSGCKEKERGTCFIDSDGVAGRIVERANSFERVYLCNGEHAQQSMVYPEGFIAQMVTLGHLKEGTCPENCEEGK